VTPDRAGHGASPKPGEAPGRRYATVTAFEAALRARLTALADGQQTYQDLRKRLAFDRVLARLSIVAPNVWLLKGGVALEYRLKRARATMDIDVSTRLDLDAMTATLEKAAALELNDYFTLRLGERSQPVDEVETHRFNISVLYENGRLFENIKVDVGFADPWLGEPQRLTAPSLLEFAGIPPATVRAIPIEQHLAEKLHAYTKRYGAHGRESSRVKDLVDMALLVDAGLNAEGLGRTLRDVFLARGAHDLPQRVPPPPSSWHSAYGRLASGLPVPATSDEAHRHIAGILDPVLRLITSVGATDTKR
jgi:hypothetical protein